MPVAELIASLCFSGPRLSPQRIDALFQRAIAEGIAARFARLMRL
jgi:hypothetical protein